MTAPRSPRGPQPADTTVLVVDDDPVILTLVERSLRAERWVRVLFMSSYSREQLLKKPFVAAQLVSRIREALSA